jgi:hypothetical protein
MACYSTVAIIAESYRVGMLSGSPKCSPAFRDHLTNKVTDLLPWHWKVNQRSKAAVAA